MRIRGAKTELEDAGLETEGMVESTAKLREEILALSGVDIMENNNTFKSTYKIMDELAAKWEDLTDIQQASVTELIAGKRQGNIVSSVMSNFDTAREALETSMNSEGSAMAEHEKWMKSVEASINKVKASWQALSQSFLKSDFLKGLLKGVSALADGFAGLFDTLGTFPTLIATLGAGMSLFKGTGFFKPIIDEATGAAKGITTTFGQAAKSVNASLKTISLKDGYRAGLDNDDITALRNYNNALNHGVSKTAAWNNCMTNTSEVAQEAAQSNEFLTGGLNGYIKAQQAAEVSTWAQNKSLGSASALMKEYHSATAKTGKVCKTTGMSQKDFANAVKQTNPQLATAMANSKTAAGGMLSYTTSLIGAKVASAALKVATMALNAALSYGIGLLISLAFEGVMKLVNADKELAEQVEELTSKFKEQHKELQKLKGSYDTSNESSMINKYAKLSKGVDNLGRNVSLTADEYSEYQSIVNQIADQIPSLISGYDEQGNALLNVKGNVEELITAYENLIKAQNNEILGKAGNIKDDFANVVEEADESDFWTGSEMTITTIRKLERMLNDNLSEEEILNLLQKQHGAAQITEALDNAGVEFSEWEWTDYGNMAKDLKNIVKTNPKVIKTIIDDFYANLETETAGMKSIVQAKLSDAFDIRGSEYYGISDTLKNVARQIANGFDYEFFASFEEGGSRESSTIEQYINNMLDQLKIASELEGTSIEAAFDLETQFNGGEISFGKYVDGLVNVGKSIDELVSNGTLDKEFATQIKLSIGLNEDGFIDEYERLRSRLAKNEYFSINTMSAEFLSFIEGLSSEELSVMWDVIPKLEKSKFKESINDVKSALELEMMLQGLTFDLDLEVETAGIEALNTALAESVTGSGLSSESITALKGRYADLEAQGYDLSSMFEETSTGIRLNRQEFDKLEDAYTTEKLADIDGDLTKMKSTYDDLGEAIKNCDDPIRKSELFNDRQTLAKRISEAATLAHQYKGLANAYNDWLKAEEAGQERDMYEKIIEGFENVDDEIKRGWIDDGTIKFLEMLTGRTDLAGKSGKQLKEVYDGLDKTIGKSGYSIRDFFTVNEDGDSTNTGVYNFLETVESFEDELGNVIERKDGNIVGFNFKVAGGDEVIAETLGVSEELVQIMVRAADDAGFVISMDGTYRQLADLQNEAKAAADYLHQIGKTDFEFDFNTTSVENLKTQLEEAHKILDDKKFWNKDGTFNFDADGATQAMQVVSTLRAKLDKLTEEQYGIGLTVEDEEFEEPLENLQEYGRTVQTLNQLRLNPEVNADEIEELEGNLGEIAKYFAGLDGEKKVEIGLVTENGKAAFTEEYFNSLSKEKKIEIGLVNDKGEPFTDYIDAVQKKIESGEVKIPTVLDIQANMDKNIETLADLALLNSGLLSEDEEKVIKQKYRVETETEVDNSHVDPDIQWVMSPNEQTRQANIEIIAKTIGTDDVVGLSETFKNLDDKTIQAIANVFGQANVEMLKNTMAKLKPTQVEAIAEAIGKGDVDALRDAVDSLSPTHVQAIAEALGYEGVADLYTAIEMLDPKTVEAIAKALGITDVETLKAAVANMQDNEVYATVNTEGQADKINTLQSEIDGLHGKSVLINVIKTVAEKVAAGGKNKAAQRTGANPDGKGTVNGTANVDGTTGRAYKQGSWGTKNSGTALVGELGREVLVRDGHYYTIGDNGAEFIKYKKGDIIFNHVQSEQLFKNGKVTADSGRAKALAGGTAFASGSTGFGGLGKVFGDAVKKVVEGAKKTVDKVASNAKKAVNNISKKSDGGSKSKDSGSSGGIGKVESNSVGKDKDKDKFEETIDFIEIAISRIEREIDNLDQKANNVYKSWSSRNKALADEISKIGEEITLQQDAAQKYYEEAEKVGLDESYAKKIREGALSIEDFEGENDEKLVEKIEEYQKWYELYLKCTDAAEKLKETEASLYAQRFENVQSQYDGILQGFEHTESMLNEYISQAEAKGHLVSEEYYNALIDNENQNIAKLKEEQSALIKARDEAIANPNFDKNSEEFYNMCAEIDSVTQAIEEGTTKLIEYNNAIRDIDWQVFDLIQERISDITAESEFLIELMSNKDLFDDNGKFTEQGVATAGLHALNYNTSMYQADEYGKEVAELDKQIAKDPYDQELINRRRELIELQRESILAAEDEKNAIKDLVEEGINLELDALQEKIDKKNEELEAERDLYDYQRQVLEQTEEIASLEKQMAAYSNNDSEEAKAKIQELKVSLEEAKTDLQETEWDRYIDQQSQLMDTLYTEYETILNTRLDNIDYLIEQVIDGINAAAGVDGVLTSALGESGAIAVALGSNATTIGETLKTEVGNVGTKLSTAMSSIWSAEGAGNKVITKYGDNFQGQQTTTNNALSNIKSDVDAMAKKLGAKAQEKINEPQTQPSTVSDPTKGSNGNKGNDGKKPSSGGNDKFKVGDKVKFIRGKYYYDSQGKKPLGSHNLGKQVYITKISTEKWSTYPYHISTGKKLGSGDLGWLKKEQLSGYATGKKRISNNEYAWTQEKGQEFIVRPSDGAILTPVAKGDSVLNATASGNIWSMANNPAEFIKDNLGLDSANIPNGANVNNSVTQHFENINFNMPNVHSYNELIAEMQRDPKFEKLILAMTLDQIAGKSKLAKNKSLR